MVTPASVVENYFAMPSNKHSGKRGITQILAVHSAECPLQRGYAKSLTNWSNTSNVEASWNAFVDPGVCVRAVNTYYAAWHASWANAISVGYETAAYAAYTREQWLTLEGRRMLERLAIEMAADAKIFDIPLRWLTGAQVNAVRAGNRTIKGLAAHRQIDPANRTDPGNGFPYAYLLKRIKHHSGVGSPAPVVEEDEMKEADFDRIRDIVQKESREAVDRRLGDVQDVPGNQATGEGNTEWTVENARENMWSGINRLVKDVARLTELVEKLPDAVWDVPVELKGDHAGKISSPRTKVQYNAHELQNITESVNLLAKALGVDLDEVRAANPQE